MKMPYLLLSIVLFLPLNGVISQDLTIKKRKNFLTLESAYNKTAIYDEYINLKKYTGKAHVPIILSYMYQGDKFFHSLSIYTVNLKLETNYSETFMQYDYCNYYGGELSYRFYYNVLNKKKFQFSAGAGLLSTGSIRDYNLKFLEYGNTVYTSSDITAASLLANIMAKYNYRRSFILISLDIPVFNYFQRPSEINSIKFSTESEWQFASFNVYTGYNFKFSIYQHLFKRLYLTGAYHANYYSIKANYPMKSLKKNLSIGFSFNF